MTNVTKTNAGERDEAGFTLIEMIVALAILAVALGTLLAAFSQDFARQRLERSSLEARMLAQSMLASTDRVAAPSTRSGVTADGFSWTIAAEPYGNDEDRAAWRFAPVAVTATVAWRDSGFIHRVTLLSLRAPERSQTP